jgi:hypothetical protein
MTGHSLELMRLPFAAFLLASVAPVAGLASDLSRYRDFEFGTSLATVAKQVGVDPSQAKLIHRRPALIQALAWRPQPLGWSTREEAAQEVVFSFHEGVLFRVAVEYDRYAIEGLTADDIVDAISVSYGKSSKPAAPAKAVSGLYGDPEEVFARWEDARFRFDLLRSSYGPSFKLVGVMKQLDLTAQSAISEATRLEEQEAPQREAARLLDAESVAKAKLEKARLVNKPKFRP